MTRQEPHQREKGATSSVWPTMWPAMAAFS
jgi:hypothetical protein